MSPAAKSVDDYMESVSDEMRPPLERLRATIRAAAPEATEVMSYGVPTFKAGSPLVSFGAAKGHYAFYVQSPEVMEAHKEELQGYDTSKGTVRFKPDEALPVDLVTKLVKARIAENTAREKK
jgi:uncharacterized protein YdhG (YjbR/CyaY superfamily)